MLSKLRNWSVGPTIRHLALEIFVVVVGVLIALGVDQWSDRRHWKTEVAQFREAADLELANNLWAELYRREQVTCVYHRLDELEELAQVWQTGAKARLDRPLVRMSRRIVRTTLWESRTPEVVAKLDLATRVAYARAYTDVDLFMRQLMDDREIWLQLQIVNWTNSMSPGSAAELLRKIEIARATNRLLAANFKTFAANAARLGVSPIPPENSDPWDREICRPMHWSKG